MKGLFLTSMVKGVRIARAMTQGQLAEATGVTRQTIINIEQNKSIPTVETAMRIAKVLEVTVEEIFSLQNKRKKVAS